MLRGRLAVVAGALLGLAWGASAQAHPHVRIDVKVEAVFNDSGEVVGLRELWIFDELYTAFAAGGLDDIVVVAADLFRRRECDRHIVAGNRQPTRQQRRLDAFCKFHLAPQRVPRLLKLDE